MLTPMIYPTHSFALSRNTLNGINSTALNGSNPSVYVKRNGRGDIKDSMADKKKGGRD